MNDLNLTPYVHIVKSPLYLSQLLTDKTLSPYQRLIILHIQNATSPIKKLTHKTITGPLGLPLSAWKKGLGRWVVDWVHHTDHMTGLGRKYRKGYNILNDILYMSAHPLTKLTLLYALGRSQMPGWKWRKEDIKRQLGISNYNWLKYVAPQLKEKEVLAYFRENGKTGIRLTPTRALKRRGKEEDIHRNMSLIHRASSIFTPLVPITSNNNLSTGRESIYSGEERGHIGFLKAGAPPKGISIAVMARFAKKFGWEKVKEKAKMLCKKLDLGKILTPIGWLWNACLRNWKDSSPMGPIEKEPTNPRISNVPNVSDSNDYLEKMFAPAPIRSPQEEEFIKQQAQEARAAIRKLLGIKRGENLAMAGA